MNGEPAVERRCSPGRAELGRKSRTARSRKGRGLQKAGPSPPSWTPDPGFYQSLARPGPQRLLCAAESRAVGEGSWEPSHLPPRQSLPSRSCPLCVHSRSPNSRPPPSSPHLRGDFSRPGAYQTPPGPTQTPCPVPSLCQSAVLTLGKHSSCGRSHKRCLREKQSWGGGRGRAHS